MMIATSLGDVFRLEEWPECMFTRQYRDRSYVAYNLKYDMGELVQHLPLKCLTELRSKGRTTYEGYRYHIIANKMYSIAKGNHYVTIYDIMQYYGGSLDYNAKLYLGDEKLEQATKKYSREYVAKNWESIAHYCVHDAELCAALAQRLIKQLNDWGMHVRKLYSTAWVSYAWFSSRCGHPSVKAFWLYDRRVLDFAMKSYAGGKFEVTRKGAGHLYEYDICSAYPSSIANLIDLYHVGIEWSNKYNINAYYGFLDCTMKIPPSLPSPVAIKEHERNIYPCGEFRKVITLQEYNYLVTNGADITINKACWIIPDKVSYPYRDEINRLVELKAQYKHGDKLAYHTIKIILNSLYGKFVQLVEMSSGKWRAGSSWNPIYGSVITAETRVRITDLQRRHPEVWAVHTDSIISDAPLPYEVSKRLGDLSYECDGEGIIIACGVYEIGGKTAIRGVPSKVTLRDLAERGGKTADCSSMQPLSWRQTLQRRFGVDEINKWTMQLKHLRPDMDSKRIWIDDWTDWTHVLERNVLSIPYALI